MNRTFWQLVTGKCYILVIYEETVIALAQRRQYYKAVVHATCMLSPKSHPWSPQKPKMKQAKNYSHSQVTPSISCLRICLLVRRTNLCKNLNKISPWYYHSIGLSQNISRITLPSHRSILYQLRHFQHNSCDKSLILSTFTERKNKMQPRQGRSEKVLKSFFKKKTHKDRSKIQRERERTVPKSLSVFVAWKIPEITDPFLTCTST
jgi:hypothetical protein